MISGENSLFPQHTPWKNTPFFKKPGVSGLETAGSSDNPPERQPRKSAVAASEGGVAPGRHFPRLSRWSLFSSAAFLRDHPVFLLQLLCLRGDGVDANCSPDGIMLPYSPWRLWQHFSRARGGAPLPWTHPSPSRWPFRCLIPPKSSSKQIV